MKRLIAGFVGLSLVLAACGGDEGAQEQVAAEEDEPAATDPPSTEPEVTDPPSTEPEVTDPPTTEPEATDPPSEGDAGDDGVREVPGEYDTIQAAVDAAVEGDLILIAARHVPGGGRRDDRQPDDPRPRS
jgi:hypothetical protein